MTVVSTAPSHIRNRYLRGGCFVLAIELHRKTGLPLWGLLQGDNLVHAFVAVPDQRIGIDIRGAMHIDDIRRGARDAEMLHAEEINEASIMEVAFSFDPADVREAKRVIRGCLHGLLARPRLKKKPEEPSGDDMPCSP